MYKYNCINKHENDRIFDYTRKRSDRAFIRDEWIEFVVQNPIKEECQFDGRIRKWAKIKEINKYLRIILLEDGETVHNAFFDRLFQEES